MPLMPHAFSETPMTFCSSEHARTLSSIMDILLVETGNRVARENWQAAQLRNLFAHAAQRSAFWRKRIGPRGSYGNIKLASLPVQTRAELRQQVTAEGCLLPAAGPEPTKKNATSGSSGTPVEFFVARMNSHYNGVRSTAQHFIDGRDSSANTLRLRSGFTRDPHGFEVTKTPMGALRGLLPGSTHKSINIRFPT